MLILFASEHFAENNFSLQQSKAARQFWWNLSRKSIVGKTFEEEILIRTLSTTLLQISREIIFNPEVVVRSIIDPDNIDQYEWIHLVIPVMGQKSPECYVDSFPPTFHKNNWRGNVDQNLTNISPGLIEVKFAWFSEVIC